MAAEQVVARSDASPLEDHHSSAVHQLAMIEGTVHEVLTVQLDGFIVELRLKRVPITVLRRGVVTRPE